MKINVHYDDQGRALPAQLRRDAWTLLEMLPEEWDAAELRPFYGKHGSFQGLLVVLRRGAVTAANVVQTPGVLLHNRELRATWLDAVRRGFDAIAEQAEG